MKTKFLILTILSGFIFSVSAQEFTPQIGHSVKRGYQTDFKKNKAFDNWFISAGAGAGVLFGDQNDKADFMDRLNLNPHLAVGKWMNPYFGMRVQFTGGVLRGFEGDHAEFMQHNRYFMGHLDFMYDVLNHLGRYNEKRIFRVIPWIGMGYAQRFKYETVGRSQTPTLNAGILTAFRLSNRVDLNVEVQGALVHEHFNRVDKGRTMVDGIGQLSAGITYRLGRTNFEVIEPMDYNLVNQMNNQINELRAQNEVLNRRPESCPDCPEVVVPVENAVSYYSENVVHFRINSSKVDATQEINVYNAAQMVKETGKSIKVTGYADSKTGTADYNLKLSEKRAQSVAKMLTDKYGIPANKITVEWKGAEVQPYDTNDWNRMVTISVSDK